MTDTIEQKALALVNKVRAGYGWPPHPTLSQHDCSRTEALCRAIEQHEAFRQEVSDACNAVWDLDSFGREQVKKFLARFILPKPDPLVEVLRDMGYSKNADVADDFRAAIEKRGGKIVWGEG